MHTLQSKLPLRIDISWMKSRSAAESSPSVDPSRIEDLIERTRLMTRILDLNPTATTGFLERFSLDELAEYHAHLAAASQPRGRSARWIRPDNVRGFSSSRSRD